MHENGKKEFLLFSKAAAKIFITAAACFFICLCFSCSKNKESASFLSSLDTIDSYISTGQADDALYNLKRIEKKAFSSYARLGIYRRYMTLGETERAEKILVRGLKSIPGNKELSAVYGQFLLRHDRVDEAEKVSACLEGTEYGSIYSEAVFRLAQKPTGGQSISDLFLKENFCSVYYDAYSVTGNECWLRNNALVWLNKGDYKTAASVFSSRKQDSFSDSNSKIFWAMVFFDSGNFSQCISELEPIVSSGVNGEDTAFADAEILISDCYNFLGDSDTAELYRKELIDESELNKNITVPPSVFVNSALWAEAHNQTEYRYKMVAEVVSLFPQYVPGLIEYGYFAYDSSKPVRQTPLEQDLRKTNLRTQMMENFDSLPRVPVSDALHRMDEALDWQKKENGKKDPLLLVASKELLYKSTPSLSPKARIADVWKTLEANENGVNLYPSALVNFAVHELLTVDRIDDARGLFESYLDSQYTLTPPVSEKNTEKIKNDVFGGEKRSLESAVPPEVVKAVLGDRAAQSVRKMEIWECETAGYFAVYDKNISAAKRLYEYVLFETGSEESDRQKGDSVNSVSQFASLSSIANLAMIYSSTEEKNKALALYGTAVGRAKDPLYKSLVLYRAACIQQEKDDEKSAVLSLEYALSLNPSFADARLMLRKLTSQ